MADKEHIEKAFKYFIDAHQNTVKSHIIRALRTHGANHLVNDEDTINSLQTVGQQGLLRAVADYKPEKGTEFLTYAGSRIHGAVRNALKGIESKNIPHALDVRVSNAKKRMKMEQAAQQPTPKPPQSEES